MLRASNGIIDLLLGRGYASDDLFALDTLECVDLIELFLELLNEALFRFFVPNVMDA